MKPLTQLSNARISSVTIPDSLRGYNARVIDETLKLSISAICSYFYCPGCAYKQYVLHIPYEETIRSLKGQIYHVAYEWFLANELDFTITAISQLSADNVTKKFHEKISNLEYVLKKRFDDKCKKFGIRSTDEFNEIKSVLERKFCKCIASILDSYTEGKEHQKDILFRDRQFEVFISANELGISGGKLDLIEDSILPVEIKTGYTPNIGVTSTHLLQLVWYTLLVEYNRGIDVDYAEVYYTRAEQRRRVTINAKLRSWAFEVRDKAADSLQPLKTNTNNGNNSTQLCVCRRQKKIKVT